MAIHAIAPCEKRYLAIVDHPGTSARPVNPQITAVSYPDFREAGSNDNAINRRTKAAIEEARRGHIRRLAVLLPNLRKGAGRRAACSVGTRGRRRSKCRRDPQFRNRAQYRQL